MKENESAVLHAAHRERMREKLAVSGASVFNDHELLELLLFGAMPRVNTNSIAHALIDRFGSLPAVLRATISELTQVDGVGPASAALIKTAFELHVRLSAETEETVYTTFEDVGELFLREYAESDVERVTLALFDKRGHNTLCRVISKGSPDGAPFDTREMVSLALHPSTAFAAIAHCHPSGLAMPSAADQIATRQAQTAFDSIHVKFIDHYIIADGRYVGINAESGRKVDKFLPSIMKKK